MSELEMNNDAESLVVNLIYQVNGALPKDIRQQDSLIKDLAMDSVEIIDFLMRLEEIGVTISESDISSNLTVGDVILYVNDKINNKD
ncbi:acyl carrier protein [Izhakiella capsodis]|uniref:Acyl carrier protein n=1 Tax=Izhakiella capsodis TaxID=1367852 RepID=A0A1I5AWM1_9GAMM|nr:acyl carrier protein [Izhakiella capsodis]SFN66838.1 acyl carrier protein [Izhakiella capsodis]